MNTGKRVELFCWGCLFNFMGLDRLAAGYLERVRSEAQPGLDERLSELSRDLTDYARHAPESGTGRAEFLKSIKKAVDELLANPVPPVGCLSAESKRSHLKKFLGQPATEVGHEGDSGFSRNPFRPISGDDHRRSIALGGVLYLLRGYCHMFGTPRNMREFNTAKQALNDCYQAYQFVWRLYQNSRFCTHPGYRQDGDQADFYTDAVREIREMPRPPDASALESPFDSAYFLWAMFVAIDIMRANIYDHTEFFEHADSQYTKALKRASALRNRSGIANIDRFVITWTMIRAKFERSKITFERGALLESLAEQLECIKYIAIEASAPPDDNPTLEKIDKVIQFLKREQNAPVWDKRIICAIFDLGMYVKDKNLRSLWDQGKTIKPLELLKLIGRLRGNANLVCPPRTERLVADIFASVAFTLLSFPLEWRQTPPLSIEHLKEWLIGYLKPDTAYIDEGSYSPMAMYCLTIVDETCEGTQAPGFGDDIERQLALRIRRLINQARRTASHEAGKYLEILDSITYHIQNLVTIPRRNQHLLMRHGYLRRRAEGDLKQEEDAFLSRPEDKFVVLRRWQSYNPKLPRPDSHRFRGGGYFLVWQGKGIVIDPGYDFIQNFYDEGFSLEDIHAVIVSHSHPDHDDDLSTLLTMMHEWNEYQRKSGSPEREKKIDLFLNESSYRKFTTWVHSRKIVLGRIVPLPLLTWDKNSEKPLTNDGQRIGPHRGGNVMIDLTGEDGYSLKLEVVPAWHDDVLNSTGAAGVVFHLFDPDDAVSPCYRLGYTGDTGAYGLGSKSKGPFLPGNITESYAECDVLIAHVGDVRLREISTAIDKPRDSVPAFLVLQDLFCCNSGQESSLSREKFNITTARDFLHLLTTLHLVDDVFYDTELEVHYMTSSAAAGSRKKSGKISELIRDWSKALEDLEKEPGSERPLILQDPFDSGLDQLTENLCLQRQLDPAIQAACMRILYQSRGQVQSSRIDFHKSDPTRRGALGQAYSLEQGIYLLLAVLCTSCRIPWTYDTHLGIVGIRRLFESMGEKVADKIKTGQLQHGVFVVGELPEELSSYRQNIARWLNKEVAFHGDDSGQAVFAFTGDIGLHIRLRDRVGFNPQIRCDYCNLNNQTIKRKEAYHSPDKIRETVIRALDSRMIYLCTEKDHHPDSYEGAQNLYLFRPEIKRI